MDRGIAVACVLAVLPAATLDAQTDRREVALPRGIDTMMLEAPGPTLRALGATVRQLRAHRPGGGVVVEGVAFQTPADRAGLQAGDIIIELDRVQVTDAGQFERLVRHTPPGRVALTVVRRDGLRRSLWLML